MIIAYIVIALLSEYVVYQLISFVIQLVKVAKHKKKKRDKSQEGEKTN